MRGLHRPDDSPTDTPRESAASYVAALVGPAAALGARGGWSNTAAVPPESPYNDGCRDWDGSQGGTVGAAADAAAGVDAATPAGQLASSGVLTKALLAACAAAHATHGGTPPPPIATMAPGKACQRA